MTFISCRELPSSSIDCEKIENFHWGFPLEWLETCWMEETSIIMPDAKFSSASDETINAFYCGNNKNIKFLPILVAEKFPNLILYGAERCSLAKISNINFKGLAKMKQLLLNQNKIEEIARDTFEGLVELEALWLRKKS